MDKMITTLGTILAHKNMTMGTAESCTGGLISATLTDYSGSSKWFTGAIVAYSNEVKMNLLNVKEQTLINHGAVSEQTVREMAEGLCKVLNTDIGISVSGIAGPTGGVPGKPVGTVCIGWHINGDTTSETFHFSGDRLSVKKQTLEMAISFLYDTLN